MSIEAINKLKAFLYRIENSRPASIEGMKLNKLLPSYRQRLTKEARLALQLLPISAYLQPLTAR
jgi:hypothetical protein